MKVLYMKEIKYIEVIRKVASKARVHGDDHTPLHSRDSYASSSVKYRAAYAKRIFLTNQ